MQNLNISKHLPNLANLLQFLPVMNSRNQILQIENLRSSAWNKSAVFFRSSVTFRHVQSSRSATFQLPQPPWRYWEYGYLFSLSCTAYLFILLGNKSEFQARTCRFSNRTIRIQDGLNNCRAKIPKASDFNRFQVLQDRASCTCLSVVLTLSTCDANGCKWAGLVQVWQILKLSCRSLYDLGQRQLQVEKLKNIEQLDWAQTWQKKDGKWREMASDQSDQSYDFFRSTSLFPRLPWSACTIKGQEGLPTRPNCKGPLRSIE